MAKRISYRKTAFETYPPICAYCGFGIPAILEVAHLDGNRRNNEIENLVLLCPTCHRMHDVDLISTEMIIQMRDYPRKADWSKLLKDAGKKAAATRKKWKALRSAAGKKGAITRRRKAAARKAVKTREANKRIQRS